MIYKCEICGEEIKVAALFIEHLESHLNQKDLEIKTLNEKLKSRVVVATPAIKSNRAGGRKPKVPFNDTALSILMQYYQHESVSQIRSRLREEAGLGIPASRIYSWIAKQRKNSKQAATQAA